MSDERGAGAVLAVAVVGAVVAFTLACLPLLGAFSAHRVAANAADAAALAAADAVSGAIPGVPCDLAEGVARRNGAELASCAVDGPTATVAVVVDAALGLSIEARARAGPPGWTG